MAYPPDFDGTVLTLVKDLVGLALFEVNEAEKQVPGLAADGDGSAQLKAPQHLIPQTCAGPDP